MEVAFQDANGEHAANTATETEERGIHLLIYDKLIHSLKACNYMGVYFFYISDNQRSIESELTDENAETEIDPLHAQSAQSSK